MKLDNRWIMPGCIIVMLLIGIILYPSLPDELPRQWGFSGEVNSTWPKLYAVLMAPVTATVIWVLTYVLPQIDPRREQYEKFGKSYLRIRQGIVVFMLGMHVLTLTQYDNPQLIVKLILFAVALFIAYLGNEMGRFRPTWFVGIRTPWTMSDERVWRQTHRIGARYYVAAGILNMLTALIFPIPIAGAIFIVSLLSVSFGTMAYSYILWRKLHA
jgi:uncharacterized membrane protein